MSPLGEQIENFKLNPKCSANDFSWPLARGVGKKFHMLVQQLIVYQIFTHGRVAVPQPLRMLLAFQTESADIELKWGPCHSLTQ